MFDIGNIFGAPTRFQVNLGNGDGTFRTGSQFGNIRFGPQLIELLVGDFNQDGVLDVMTQTSGKALNLYFGKGDGTFSLGQVVQMGGGLTAMVAGDFNGDGKLDLAVEVGVAGKPQQIRILLGNGDGTFQVPRVVLSNLSGFLGYPNLVLTDLNGDGVPDLLYNQNSQMGVLIGRGDGTFKNLGFLSDLTGGLVVGDFNSDGNVDLLLSSSSAVLRLGNGDGTFGADQSVNITLGNGLGLAADFNSDGLMEASYGNIYLQQ